MGWAKRQMEESFERGWNSVSKHVCEDCVIDPALAQLIVENAESEKCDYCERESDRDLAAPVDLVLGAVVDGLKFEYEDPVEQVMYSTRDGGYQVDGPHTWDLLCELVTECEPFHRDLNSAIQIEQWVQRNPYRPAPHEALGWGWQGFRKYVMHERRFTFLLATESSDQQRSWGEIPPEDMPVALSRAIEDGDLAAVIPAGTILFRARAVRQGEVVNTAAELGTPPPQFAKSNRMTPAGIGGFYAASTADAAIAEVRGYAGAEQSIIVGRFILGKDMPIIDLMEVPEVPSLFDEERRELRASIRFLRDFVDDVTRSADPDTAEYLDYVPTQIVAEYLREEYPHPLGKVFGVRWSSSKSDDASCVVLFLSNAECVDHTAGWGESGALLALLDVDTA